MSQSQNQLKIINNLKVIKIMKSCAYTDDEIAAYIGVPVKDFLDEINAEPTLKNIYDNAAEKLASEIEMKFLTNVMNQLDNGDNTDAKFVLERTNKKYQKKDVVDVTIKSIDDIIRES